MRMRRREFVLGLAMLAAVGRASAQDHVRRVGILTINPVARNILETVLKEKGWIVGQISRLNIESLVAILISHGHTPAS
jgi:hypothetical protein